VISGARTKLKKNKMKNLIIICLLLTLISCRAPDNFGFYQPITMSLKVPDGPAEYQAGWHAGCKTALSQKAFSNSSVYLAPNHGPDLGNGIYQHDSAFQTGWGQGWFACGSHIAGFVGDNYRAMKYGPLD